jgi:hypothetical protein
MYCRITVHVLYYPIFISSSLVYIPYYTAKWNEMNQSIESNKLIATVYYFINK